MSNRDRRDTEYVVVREGRPKKTLRYYYNNDDDDDDDDDDDVEDVQYDQESPPVRHVIRRKPVREQRIKYVTADVPEHEYRSAYDLEPKERSVRVRHTTNGEQVLIDEDDNVIKVIRNTRSPTPPMVERRRIRIRPREVPHQYYKTQAPTIVKSSPRKHIIVKHHDDHQFTEEEPSRIIRKVIIDPNNVGTQTVNDKVKLKKVPKQYMLKQRPVEVPIESDDEERTPPPQQTQYVQVVQKPTVAPQIINKKEPTTKYVMIRKKNDSSDPVYAVTSSVPVVKSHRRVIYENPTKQNPTAIKYDYEPDGKNYK